MAGLALGLGLGTQRRGSLRPAAGYELREDGGGRELREDGSLELREDAIAAAYVEPSETDDPPEMPPTGGPTPPGDTPTDPDTGEPEPGVDPDFTAATRIELADQKQTVIRTTADPGTWGNAYVAAELDGADYWEIHISNSTPQSATLAVGITNLDLPLNGIPGDEAGTLAYWSSGVIRNNGADTSGYPRFRKGDKIRIARDHGTGRVWFGVNGTWLGSTPAVGGSGHQGTLTADGPYFPFVAIYSTFSQATFKFALSKFSYAVPDGFASIGQSDPVLLTNTYNDYTTGSGSTRTYSSVPLGAEAEDRLIIVVCACGTTGGSVTTLTIGGVSADPIVQLKSDLGDDFAAIFSLLVPTGATATIAHAIDGGETMSSNLISVFRASGLQSTTVRDTAQTATTSGSPVNQLLDVLAGGIAVGAASQNGGTSGVSFTAGLSNVHSGGSWHSSGSYASVSETDELPRTITFNGAASTYKAAVCASWK